MTQSPLASVIVIFDRGELEPCLASLLAQTGAAFEVMAVVPDENALSHLPADGRVRGLAIANRNPAFRRNAAAARARGQYLAFIDDDAAAPPDWLKQGVEFLENFPIYAGVGGPNLGPPGAGMRERISDMLLATPVIGAGSRAYRGGGKPADAKTGEVHLVNFIVRRDWFDRVNGLNEALGYGGEDTEFLYQVKKLGGRFRFDPGLTVTHRRRPFGLPYFRQRFHLRRQSAKLFVAYPDIYIKSIPFLAALLMPPLLVFAMILLPPQAREYLLFAIVLLYGSCTAHFFWSDTDINKLTFSLILPAAFFSHHCVYLAGFWFGLAEAMLTGPGRLRRRIRRTMDSCAV